MNKVVDYLKETKGEMKHVSWPKHKQSAYFTILIIAISVLTSLYLGFFDFAFTKLLDLFIISK